MPKQGLQRSSYGVLIIGGKLYSVINHESVLLKAEILVLVHSSEMHKDDCLKKTSKFSHSFINWGCMLQWESLSQKSKHMCTMNFLILLIENRFNNDKANFQINNVCHNSAKSIKAFLRWRYINFMTWKTVWISIWVEIKKWFIMRLHLTKLICQLLSGVKLVWILFSFS